MLLACRTHKNYQSFLGNFLPDFYRTDPKRLESFTVYLTALWFLDLDPVIPQFLASYSLFGRPAIDPTNILRSLVLMTMLRKAIGITEWVKSLNSDRVLAVLSGFIPGEIPAVGTFYGFFSRFGLEFCQSPQEQRLRCVAVKRNKNKCNKLRKGEKLPNKHPKIVARLVNQVLKGRRMPKRPERFIQFIFARCVVDKSISLGLIPTQKIPDSNLITLLGGISGDGTAVKTAASPHGSRVCDCGNHDIFKCDCPRRFSDRQANWGWDSHNELYFYGRHFYPLSATGALYDLPLFFTLAQASRHDSVQGVVALTLFRDLHPNLNIPYALWDSAHDSYAFYLLHKEWGIEPFIDLNQHNKAQGSLPQPLSINQFGIPYCSCGLIMSFDGFDKNRSRLKWRCPKMLGSKASRKKASNTCPGNCSPSSYGRTIYTKPADDLRLFTETPRNSAAWKDTYKERSTSERINKRLMVDYQMKRCRVRSDKQWFWRGHLASTCIHLDAWAHYFIKNGFIVWNYILPVQEFALAS